VLVPFARDNGVQVRGIQMLNGFGEFCEDYFDGARAPLDNVIGGLNNGWQVAMTALSYERGAEATTQYLAYLPEFWAIVDQARKIGRDDDPLTRQQLAQAYLNVELMRYGGMRTLARLIHGLSPGPLEAINKLHKSEYHRWLGEVAIDLDDTSGLIRPQGTGYPTTRWQDLFLSSRAGTIYSGTSEIQRNIVGERMLGLPKEPAADARAGAKGTSPRATSAPAATMARGVSGQDQALPGFLPNTEQQALAKNVRVFLASQSPVSAARELMTEPAGFDRRCWDLMATQLGLHGLRIPEQFGGSEQGFTELRIVLSELGRELYTGPYLSSMLTIEAIIASADAGTMARLLPSLADGTAIGALAIWDEVGAYRSSEIRTRAHHNKYGWTLEGDKAIVLHGQAATVLITAAATEGGLSLFAVDASAAGVSVNPQPALDQTRQIASIRLEGAPGSLIGQEGAAGPLIQTILDRAALAIAADSLGVAERVLEMTVDYAKMRNQFGRPIGSFQAVKHKCADMLKSIELGRSAIYYAAHIADTEPAELTPAASIAKIQCAEACTIAAAESIQIHGGVGFTWEHDAHLYFKRARANATLFGNQAFHRERLLYAIGV
jgi:alkylation response protein AidB-like acyl-CoA dehydrogenase